MTYYFWLGAEAEEATSQDKPLPAIVTWGDTYPVTWRQWSTESVGWPVLGE